MVHYRNLYNARVRYFAQLSKLSDTVVVSSWTKEPEIEMETLRKKHIDIAANLKVALTKNTYVSNISKDDVEKCTICQDSFEHGFVTECGHISCKNCCENWVMIHKKCHMCQAAVVIEQLYKITHKPKPKVIAIPTASMSQLQTKISQVKILESFGAKTNMIVKHVSYLLKEDPSVKVFPH